MAEKPGTQAPPSGYYGCSVCKAPARFEAGRTEGKPRKPKLKGKYPML